jgi:hypothetical protein
LRTRDEIKRRADAEHSGPIQLVEASRREYFLTRRAEGDEAKPRAGNADAVDRKIGLV